MRQLLLVIVICALNSTCIHASTAKTGMRNISARDLVKDMRVGWNLGNTLDARGPDERFWGNPRTTKAMIDEIAKMGFKTFRLPVTWEFHTGPAPDYTVEKAWMDRVEEVANYAFDNNMYVIINTHHDEWIVPTNAKRDEVKARLEKLWTQIANRFKEYGDYLILETMNEPRHHKSPEEWTGGTAEGRDLINQYHKVCVDAIRATGGNNATRKLMICTYAASTVQKAMDDLVIPNNDKNTIVSIHSYFPYFFCLEGSQKTWGTDKDKRDMDHEFDRIYKTFVVKGKAVVMGEWCNIENGDNLEDRLRHADYYTKCCKKIGITPVWWDAGNTPRPAWLLDRSSLKWVYPQLSEIVTQDVAPVSVNKSSSINCSEKITDFKKKSDIAEGLSFEYHLNRTSSVSIIITSLSGKKIGGQKYGYRQPGSYVHFIDRKLIHGVYIISLKTDTRSETFRFLVK